MSFEVVSSEMCAGIYRTFRHDALEFLRSVLGHLGYTSHFCFLGPPKRWFWAFLFCCISKSWRTCHSRVGRGGVGCHYGRLHHALRLKDVSMAPLMPAKGYPFQWHACHLRVGKVQHELFFSFPPARLQPYLRRKVLSTSLSPRPVVIFWFGWGWCYGIPWYNIASDAIKVWVLGNCW